MNGLEIELKTELSAADAREVTRLLQLGAGAGVPAMALNAIYYDTADRHLAQAGMALRVRREGRRMVQTVKSGRSTLGGFHQVREVESRARGMTPDLSLLPDAGMRAALEAQIDGRPLTALFETRVSRRRWTIQHAHGLVEVALDRGEIHSGAAREAVLEAEFELLGGSPEALFAVAAELVGGTSARLTLPSKAARGLALMDGKRKPPRISMRKPRAPVSGTDGGFAWSAALEALAPAIATNLHALFTSDEPEGPHQLRVALRRLRAAVRLHKPLIEPGLAQSLADEARTIGQIVAPLRDSDVLGQEVLDRLGKKPDPLLPDALSAHRAQVRAEVRAALRANGATGFAIRLLGLAAVGGWRPGGRPEARSVEALAGRSLENLWERGLEMGDRLSALADEERHEFRKILKKVRYTLELIPESVAKKSFTSALKKLQEDLGTLNDISVLDSWSPGLEGAEAAALLEDVKADLLEAARAKGDLALGRACRHWRELRGRERPWAQSPSLSRLPKRNR